MSSRRGPGRPKNPERSVVIPVTVPQSIGQVATLIAAHAGLARATWVRQELMAAIRRHGRRVG